MRPPWKSMVRTQSLWKGKWSRRSAVFGTGLTYPPPPKKKKKKKKNEPIQGPDKWDMLFYPTVSTVDSSTSQTNRYCCLLFCHLGPGSRSKTISTLHLNRLRARSGNGLFSSEITISTSMSISANISCWGTTNVEIKACFTEHSENLKLFFSSLTCQNEDLFFLNNAYFRPGLVISQSAGVVSPVKHKELHQG